MRSLSIPNQEGPRRILERAGDFLPGKPLCALRDVTFPVTERIERMPAVDPDGTIAWWRAIAFAASELSPSRLVHTGQAQIAKRVDALCSSTPQRPSRSSNKFCTVIGRTKTFPGSIAADLAPLQAQQTLAGVPIASRMVLR